ncbi:delta-class carbonic anhydrase [Shewanella violacea]|uniref:Cadmium carbonic anhydrase n=1 Tax=Shewanella violacea (strain JCM 10179 / CIP 106290 / LMG 19151 / DSS12) TaxID=637905 RepID=D4ZG09_SHEVD|nr:delta-class carbonic anhydrase [Shewanella violacea]BAJ00608.1 hypothetical protein SVI_0637 [Shewanella violacea DSS12]
MINKTRVLCATAVLFPLLVNAATAADTGHSVSDKVIEKQRAALATNTQGKGYGPQSPRDIDTIQGSNQRIFGEAPDYTEMNLCNIHFHINAEHKGGEFTKYAGNGDGHGYNSGYQYTGKLSKKELTPLKNKIGVSKHGSLHPGDTIEVHYVHSTAQVGPGATLGSCLSEANSNPQLRVETQVFVLVNDTKAMSFMELTKLGMKNGLNQALNIPSNTGKPVQYEGSTTGPGYNEIASPLQVSWSVRPQVMKVDIHTVGKWLEGNAFDEDHAHGVRNLVVNPALLSDSE